MAEDKLLIDVPLERVQLIRGRQAIVIHFKFRDLTDQIAEFTEEKWREFVATFGATKVVASRSKNELCLTAGAFPDGIAPDLGEFANSCPFPLDDFLEERELIN
jgi:hypothetical protein